MTLDSSPRVFGESYASIYDSLYGDKDYAAEARLINDVFARFATRPVRRILDLGCGSGNHLVPLVAMGFDAVGVDRSPAMLAQARAKLDIPLHEADLRHADLHQHFDAVLMMFAVLGYQTTNRDLYAALHNVRKHLQPGGLFVFDCWFGPAVLHLQPSPREKVIPTPQGPMKRHTTASLDLLAQTCTVHFQIEQPSASAPAFTESHEVRFFFPQELRVLLHTAGLELLHLGAFPDWTRSPNLSDWNVLGVAAAV